MNLHEPKWYKSIQKKTMIMTSNTLDATTLPLKQSTCWERNKTSKVKMLHDWSFPKDLFIIHAQ